MPIWGEILKIKNVPAYLKPLENPPKWTEEEKKIIAWSIDWEGSISIHKSSSKTERRHKKVDLQPLIIIGNTNKRLLKKFYDIVKLGHFYPRKPRPKQKDVWIWTTTSFEECQFILENVLPYLLSKRKQGEVVLEFIKSRIDRGIKEVVSIPYSRKEFLCVEKIRKLNKRGK